ncbi:hypothetical protein GGS20DRAFT_537391 [Poronia punctata]|nr:hypothetical protein GGS20DRAFT_537391 [Poronia punctata]
MHFLGPVLSSLALVAPALAISQASSTVPTTLQTSSTALSSAFPRAPAEDCDPDKALRCNGDIVQECQNGIWADIMTCIECHQEDEGFITCTNEDGDILPVSVSPAQIEEATMLPQKRDHHDDCSPGDRACHADLDKVIFCNDHEKWVTYTECGSGAFCHRLFMICVPEIFPPFAQQPGQPEFSRPITDTNKCKEGDRRCSSSFNRVDRCNGDNEWVTYHDCRKSESCNNEMCECWPLGPSAVPPLNATST